MGALYIPALAASTSLTVDAELQDGDLLQVEIRDNETGAVSTVELQLSDYTDNPEIITIQAINADGKASGSVVITNPNHTATVQEREETPPPSVTESAVPDNLQPFTPPGTGTVVDNVLEQNGKEFFTVTTEAGNDFFIIVDRHRNTDNVYLLNAVTEQDLMALAQPGDGTTQSGIPDPPPPPPMPESETEPTTEPKPQDNGRGGNSIFIIVLAIAAVGGAGYYFKVIKPKQQGFDNDDYESALDEDDDFEQGGDDE